MEPKSVQDALAAHADGDAAALSNEICRLLSEERRAAPSDSVEEEEEEGEAVVAQVLEHLQTRPACLLHAVAAPLACVAVEDNEEEEESVGFATRKWDLLNGLLQQAKQRLNEATEEGEPEKQPALPGMLVAYAARIATELTRSAPALQRVKMLVLWADTVVDLAVQIPVNAATAESAEPQEDASWVVRLVGEFFRVHQHSLAVQTDFRVMTLVWKNLNKLSAVYRTKILALGGGETGAHTEGTATAYSFSAAFEAAATGLARTIQRLRATTVEYADQDIASELRLLRLFVRAFQGQFVQFVDAMVAQVECSVALAVDAIAAVVPIAEAHVTESEKTQHEAIRVLQCVISFVETMARSDKLQASTRSFVGTLLWQPRDKMITLVQQMRSQYVDANEAVVDANEAVLEWGHVLALAAFYAAHGDDNDAPSLNMESSSSPASVTTEFTGVATVFTRFRAWGSRVLVGEYSKSLNLFVDIVLDSLVAQAQSTAPLQLFLIEQTLHPDPNQRFVVWELWRELMCFVWEEAVVRAAFDTLLELTYTKNSNGYALQADVREEILGLLAFIYPGLCDSVKQEYLRVGSSAFEAVCAEGPGHKLTPQLASSFDLLELLATSSLLVEYDHPDKEDWIAHRLPVAMECLGSVHDFLDQGQPMRSAERCGVIRVLDAGLLVVRAIFEDNDKDEVQNAHGLGSMVLPMCAETVTHLAKLVQPSHGDDATSSLVSTRSFTRVLRNCLEMLTTLAPLVKANRSNQCVQLIKDLLTILQSDHELRPHAVAIAIFIRDALGDMWVMPSDADIVWKMLGCVFHKLSALHFGLQVTPITQSLTPLQSVCLEAIYALMARSNLPDFAHGQRDFKSWIVPHAQPRFAVYVQMMCKGPQAAEADKRANCEQWCRYDRLEAIMRLRFPSVYKLEEEQPSKKREREYSPSAMQVDSPPTGEDVDMDQQIETAKRIKWDEFATTYWQLHDSLSSLSSPDLQEAFLDRLTEGDLDHATSALQALLRKNPTVSESFPIQGSIEY